MLADIKQRIRTAQVRAGLAANRELVLLYCELGLTLEQRTRTEAWSTSVIDRLARDLQKEFPGMDGLSSRNLRRMRAFYRAYPLAPRALAMSSSWKR